MITATVYLSIFIYFLNSFLESAEKFFRCSVCYFVCAILCMLSCMHDVLSFLYVCSATCAGLFTPSRASDHEYTRNSPCSTYCTEVRQYAKPSANTLPLLGRRSRGRAPLHSRGTGSIGSGRLLRRTGGNPSALRSRPCRPPCPAGSSGPDREREGSSKARSISCTATRYRRQRSTAWGSNLQRLDLSYKRTSCRSEGTG